MEPVPRHLVEVQGELCGETESAYHFVIDGKSTDEAVWLPKSLCEWSAEDNATDGVMTLPEWLANKEGLT